MEPQPSQLRLPQPSQLSPDEDYIHNHPLVHKLRCLFLERQVNYVVPADFSSLAEEARSVYNRAILDSRAALTVATEAEACVKQFMVSASGSPSLYAFTVEQAEFIKKMKDLYGIKAVVTLVPKLSDGRPNPLYEFTKKRLEDYHIDWEDLSNKGFDFYLNNPSPNPLTIADSIAKKFENQEPLRQSATSDNPSNPSNPPLLIQWNGGAGTSNTGAGTSTSNAGAGVGVTVSISDIENVIYHESSKGLITLEAAKALVDCFKAQFGSGTIIPEPQPQAPQALAQFAPDQHISLSQLLTSSPSRLFDDPLYEEFIAKVLGSPQYAADYYRMKLFDGSITSDSLRGVLDRSTTNRVVTLDVCKEFVSLLDPRNDYSLMQSSSSYLPSSPNYISTPELPMFGTPELPMFGTPELPMFGTQAQTQTQTQTQTQSMTVTQTVSPSGEQRVVTFTKSAMISTTIPSSSSAPRRPDDDDQGEAYLRSVRQRR